jgi:hypothetical protein
MPIQVSASSFSPPLSFRFSNRPFTNHINVCGEIVILRFFRRSFKKHNAKKIKAFESIRLNFSKKLSLF